MRQFAVLWLALLWLNIAQLPALQAAQAARAPDEAATAWQGTGPAQARLIAGLAPTGEAVLAVEMRLEAGWHTYWRNPGASGIKPSFDWTGSGNVTLAEPLYQAPRRFSDMAGDYFGYAGGTIFLVPISAIMPMKPVMPATQTEEDDEGLMRLRLRLDAGVCREICVPVTFNLALDVMPSAFQQSPYQPLLAAAYQKLPSRASERLQIAALTYDGVSLNMVITGQNLANIEIIIAGEELDIFDKPRIIGRDKSAWLVEIPAWAGLDTPFIGRRLHIVLNDGTYAIAQDMLVSEP